MADARSEGPQRWFELDRIVAYSDGVFAIAMTLLVLTLDAPDLQGGGVNGQLRRYVRDQAPEFLGFALSFFIVARYWIAHHRLFQVVRRSTPTLVSLNLVVLFFVVLVPYPTELYGDYPETQTAAVLYAVALSVAGLSMAALTWYVVREHNLVDDAVTDSYITHSTARGLTLPLLFLASIPVALVEPTAAPFVWLLVFPVRFLLTRRYGPIHEPFDAGTR